MKWTWPFVPRTQHDAVLADLDRIRAERTQFAKDRDTYKAAAEKSAALFADADATNIRLTGRIRILGERLLAADVASGFNPVQAKLTAERIARLQRGAARARREAAETRRSAAAAEQQRLDAAPREPADGEWRGRARRAEKDVERLQKRLDDAVGLPPGGPLSSAVWQPGYQAPAPDKRVAP